MTPPDLATRLAEVKARWARYLEHRSDYHAFENYIEEDDHRWLIEQAEELARLRDERTHATIDDLPTTLEDAPSSADSVLDRHDPTIRGHYQ